jgi:hypothetical protein
MMTDVIIAGNRRSGKTTTAFQLLCKEIKKEKPKTLFFRRLFKKPIPKAQFLVVVPSYRAYGDHMVRIGLEQLEKNGIAAAYEFRTHKITGDWFDIYIESAKADDILRGYHGLKAVLIEADWPHWANYTPSGFVLNQDREDLYRKLIFNIRVGSNDAKFIMTVPKNAHVSDFIRSWIDNLLADFIDLPNRIDVEELKSLNKTTPVNRLHEELIGTWKY